MYSENQIVKILENKEVKVKTIEQSEPNWSGNFDSVAPQGLNAGITYTSVYSRLEKIGNVLYVVNCFKLKNNTAENLYPGNFNLTIENIDESVSSKIIDLNGKPLNETGVGGAPISADYGFSGDQNYPTSLNRSTFKCVLSRAAGDSVNAMRINEFHEILVKANTEQLYTFRTFLTLL